MVQLRRRLRNGLTHTHQASECRTETKEDVMAQTKSKTFLRSIVMMKILRSPLLRANPANFSVSVAFALSPCRLEIGARDPQTQTLEREETRKEQTRVRFVRVWVSSIALCLLLLLFLGGHILPPEATSFQKGGGRRRRGGGGRGKKHTHCSLPKKEEGLTPNAATGFLRRWWWATLPCNTARSTSRRAAITVWY